MADGLFYQVPNASSPVSIPYVDGNNDGFIDGYSTFQAILSGVTLNFNGPPTSVLPVELLYFTGRAKDSEVTLQWATATELDNSHFEVERSADGREYEFIGKVQGAGTHQGLLEYDFTDDQPHLGLNYYRLRQVDFDGAFEYSNVVAIEVEGKAGGGISVFPNPASNQVEVGLPAQLLDQALDITIRDLSGKIVLRHRQPAGQRIAQLPLEGIPSGYYTVNVQAGSRLLTEKLIVE